MRRWMAQVFSLEIRKLLSYRFEFWMNFLMTLVVHITAAFFLWKSVFDYRDLESLGGYSFRALMMYYILVPLVDRMVRGPERFAISQEIYDGSLNRYLIYPVSFTLFKYITNQATIFIFFLQFLLALGAYLFLFGLPADVNFTWLNLLFLIPAVFCAGLMYFFVALCLELLAFWADNVWSLLVFLRFGIYFFGGGMAPLSLFPEWARALLVYSPFPYVLNFPIRIAMGKFQPDEFLPALGICLCWGALAYGVSRLIWRRGMKTYTGVGI